jgi:hypothetical protein
MIHRFKKVQDGVFRGSAPSIEDVVFLNRNLGVKKIISLDYTAGKRIDRVCKLLGIKHVMLPIDINKKSSLLNFLKHDISTLLLKDGPTFLHCAYGRDRTGFAIALFRCESDGWSYDKALKEAYSLGFGDGIPHKLKQLYLQILNQACEDRQDHNDAYDIVSNQREYPSDYQDYTLGPFEQQSWSPYADYRVREFPYASVNDYPSSYPNEQFSSDVDYHLDNSDIVSKYKRKSIPQSGQYESIPSSMMGFGPSYVGTGYI